MKKWFCIISIVVLCLTLNSMVFAASFVDVTGTKYQNAVDNLVEVGLVNGFEDNTYRPNVAVTRAQMAKLMVIALGEEGQVNNVKVQSSVFTDINSGHWAYGYVNVAKNIGVINGYTDGRFDPDATVSYAEAITMAVRALGYEPKVAQSSEVWPNNYINCARDLSMLRNLSTFSNNTGAARGDVAILLWNMLNTGVCVAKAQNSSGIVYGQGELMLVKYKSYVYLEDGMITDIDFDDDFENATVTVEGSSNTIKLSMSDTDVFKYFGKTLKILYNSRTKKIVSMDATKNLKEDSGNVTKVTTKKITIDDTDYTLPSKSNIFLYKIDDLDDAIEATAYLDGKTLKYIIASGAKEVQVGLVTETDITVSKKDGIKVKKVGSSSTSSYALIDEDDMPERYSVILYYLNSDNRLGIIKEVEEDDGLEIASLTSTKIKLGKNTYTYDSDSFKVIAITTSSIKTLSFKNIDEDDDLVYAYEYGGITYLLVFTDAYDNESNKTQLYKDLQSYISSVEAKVKKESSYSQATFVPFLKAYNTAIAVKSSSTTSVIKAALDDLKSANSSLKQVTATSEDGKIASKRAELRSLVDGQAETVVKNKAKYTSASYNKFNTELTASNKILTRTNTTLKEVNNQYTKLSDAIDNLVLNEDSQGHTEALAALNEALERSKEVLAKDNYTESSYNSYKIAYDNAVSAKNNASTKTATELKTATDNLNSAIDKLELALDSIRDAIKDLIVEYLKIDNKDEYMPDTISDLDEAYDYAVEVVDSDNKATLEKALSDFKKAMESLKLISEKLADTISAVQKMKNAPSVSEALDMKEEKPEEKLQKIENIEKAVKIDLEDLIDQANTLDDSSGELDIAIGNAKGALKGENLSKIVDNYVKLKAMVDSLPA